MAVMGIVTDVKKCMEVYYLNEDIWIEKAGNDFIHLFVVFKTLKNLDCFYIFFHGKPINPKSFHLYENVAPVKNKIVLLHELAKNREYLEKEGWLEGPAEPTTPKCIRLEQIRQVTILDQDDIKTIDWENERYKECSILKVRTNPLKKGKIYGIRLGVFLSPPKPMNFGIKSKINYRVHYCTFRDVCWDDRTKISKIWRNEHFAPVYFRMPISGREGGRTSTLMVYLHPKYELISPTLKTPVLKRNFNPISTRLLSPPWNRYKWNVEDVGKSKLIPKITINPEKEEEEPRNLMIKRFDVNTARQYILFSMPLFLAIFALVNDFALALVISLVVLLVVGVIIDELIEKPLVAD